MAIFAASRNRRRFNSMDTAPDFEALRPSKQAMWRFCIDKLTVWRPAESLQIFHSIPMRDATALVETGSVRAHKWDGEPYESEDGCC